MSTNQLFDFVVRKTTCHPGPFLATKSDNRERIEFLVVQAVDGEDAIKQATRKSSVLSLEYGEKLEAVKIPWGKSTKRFAKYSEEPMIDHGRFNPKAKLVISKVIK